MNLESKLQVVVTATSFVGDGSALTGMASTDNVRTGILDVAGISTFRSNSLVGSGITLSPDGNGFFTGDCNCDYIQWFTRCK